MKSENKNKHGGDKNLLDNYFKAASNEKVDFTRKDAEKLVAKHIALTLAAGWIGKSGLKYLLGGKALTAVIVPVTVSLAILAWHFTPDSEKEATLSKAVEQIVEKSISVIDSSMADTNKNYLTNQTIPGAVPVIISSENDNSTLAEKRANNQEKEDTKTNGLPRNLNSQAMAATAPEKTQEIIEYFENYPDILTGNYKPDSRIGVEKPVMAIPSDFFPAGDYDPIYDDEEFDSNEIKTLSTILEHSGWYGAPMVKSSSINGKNVILAGGKIGWVMNKKYSIGITGYGLTNGTQMDVWGSDIIDQSTKMYMGYGGLLLEYFSNSDDLLHYTFSTTLGFGGASVSNGITVLPNQPWTVFTVVEPGAGAEINLMPYVKFGFEASYRYVYSFKSSTLFREDASLRALDLSNMSIGFYVKAGIF